jgi:hypothetical protein
MVEEWNAGCIQGEAGNEFKRRRTMKAKNELESAEIKNTNDTVRAEWEGLSEADWEKISCGFVYDIFSRFNALRTLGEAL